MAAALDASLDVVADEPERRERLARRVAAAFARSLAQAGIAVSRRRFADHPDHHRRERPGRRGRRGAAGAGFDVRAIRPPTVPAGHGAPAGVGERRADRGDARSVRRRARRGRCRRRTPAPRPLRNRHRHRRRQDGGVGRAAAALPRRSAAPILEADSDRHRAGRRHGRGAAVGGVRAGRDLSTACDCRNRSRRIWRRAGRDADRPRRNCRDSLRRRHRRHRWIVEGAGGVLVPINDAATMADLMARLGAAGRRRGAQRRSAPSTTRC